MDGVDSRTDIRDFLATRRARLTPEQVGLPAGGRRRRVPGLRREEVAVLAGVSTEWYTRLEKGHISGVSDDVLEAVAQALQLDEAERTYLFDLARAARPANRTPRRRKQAEVRPRVQWMLDSMTSSAAFVRNGRMDILAINALGRALYSPMFADDGSANIARYQFLDPSAQDYFPDWDGAANVTVALLRARSWPRPAQQGPASPRGRAVHAQRRVPRPMGGPQRADPSRREEAVQPPRGRAARSRLPLPGPCR